MNVAVREIIQKISDDRELKREFRQALELDTEYATKTDISQLIQELRAQREENHAAFEKIWEEFAKQREEMAAQREETRKGFEKVWEEFAKQREENRTAFEKVWEEFAKQREEMAAQREEMAAQRKETRKGFEKVWEEMAAQRKVMEKGFAKLHQRLDKHEDYLAAAGGTNLEQYSLMWWKGILKSKQIPADNLVWNKIIHDEEEILGTAKFEIDVFQDDPLVAVEITSYIKTIDKIAKFSKKLKVLKRIYKKEPRGVMICYRISKEIEDTVEKLTDADNILLITIGSDLDFDDI